MLAPVTSMERSRGPTKDMIRKSMSLICKEKRPRRPRTKSHKSLRPTLLVYFFHLALPSTVDLIFTAFPSVSDCELNKVHSVSSCHMYSDVQSSLSRNSAAQPYQSVVMNHLHDEMRAKALSKF